MKKNLKYKNRQTQSWVKFNMSDILIKIQQQIDSLEKKIDVLIDGNQKKSFDGKKDSEPFQHFGRPQNHSETRRGDGYRERVLFKAICADCGRECEVPFRPSGERPVYCKECFAKRKAASHIKAKTYYGNKPIENKASQERHFDKYNTSESPRPVGEKKISKKRKK